MENTDENYLFGGAIISPAVVGRMVVVVSGKGYSLGGGVAMRYGDRFVSTSRQLPC